MGPRQNVRNLFAELLFDFLWLVDHLFGPAKRQSFRRTRSKLHRRILQSKKQQNEFQAANEKTIPFLTAADLRTLPNDRPIVFRALGKDTQAYKVWSLEYLSQRHGKVLQPFYGSRMNRNVEVFPFGVFTDQIQKGRANHAYYGGDYDILNLDSQLQREVDLNRCLDTEFLRGMAGRADKIFVSGKSHWTPTHADIGGNLNFQIRGRKRWLILKPQDTTVMMPEVTRTAYIQSDLFADGNRLRDGQFGVRGWEVTLDEGDVLWVPSFFWHFVETLENSISISVKWLTPKMAFTRPFLSFIAATSRNPNLVASYLRGSSKLPPLDLFTRRRSETSH